MDSMEPLLRLLPNFRIIHLIRDPRAVALSRIEFDASARGSNVDSAPCTPSMRYYGCPTPEQVKPSFTGADIWPKINSDLSLVFYKAGSQKMVMEAMLYCRTVSRDLVTRRLLMRHYPNRIYPLMYDDVVRDLSAHTKHVYRFIDERLPARTIKWIGNNARRKRNGTTIATRWQNSLTVHQNEQILSVCSELFRLLRLAPDSN